MPTIERVKDIVTAALIAVPIFYIGGKVMRMIRDEISPSEEEDESVEFEDDN